MVPRCSPSPAAQEVVRDVVSLPKAQRQLAEEQQSAEETTFRRHLKVRVEVQATALPYQQEPFAMAEVEVPKAAALRWRVSKCRQEMSARARSLQRGAPRLQAESYRMCA